MFSDFGNDFAAVIDYQIINNDSVEIFSDSRAIYGLVLTNTDGSTATSAAIQNGSTTIMTLSLGVNSTSCVDAEFLADAGLTVVIADAVDVAVTVFASQGGS